MMKLKQTFVIARKIYSTGIILCTPLLRFHQWRRALRGKEDKSRRCEREGIASVNRPEGKIIWFHCASVGESMAALPVIEKILDRQPDASVLMTTGTMTSARLMAGRLPTRAIHQYAPLDHPTWVARFLDHWKPDAAVWVESEFWPNTLWALKQRSVPLMLVNGRVSEDSYLRWKRVPGIIQGILDCFDICLAQTEQDAWHLSDLGARQTVAHGNLKLGAAPLPVDDKVFEVLDECLAGRPRWLMSSSHEGEELIAARIHSEVSSQFPSLLTIIVPRHPNRGRAIAEMLQNNGLNVALRSRDDILSSDTDIYVADTMGELGLLYRLCDIVFMGKSLIRPGGGQNPYEPAKLGCAVLFGPNMGNFIELSDDMQAAGAAKEVADADVLCREVSKLLGGPDNLAERKRAAMEFCSSAENIIGDTVARINNLTVPDNKIEPQ